jgi:hypothetical protein
MLLTVLPGLEAAEQSEQVLKAEAENIAKGGIGMFCYRLIPAGTVVRCHIALLDLDVYIPTLMKVRWINLLESKTRYRMGLQFLV